MTEYDDSPAVDNAADEPASAEGPGVGFEVYLKSESLLEKLRLLNYETGFLGMRGTSVRPLNGHYFARSTNAGEQFPQFTALAAWLIRECGKPEFPMPNDVDDPNQTIASLLSEARELGLLTDLPVSQLRKGSGEAVVEILDGLADKALEKKTFLWTGSVPPEVEDDDDVNADADGGDLADQNELVAEEMNEPFGNFGNDLDEDEDAIATVELRPPTSGNVDTAPDRRMLWGSSNRDAWAAELDRVLPQLKVTLSQETKDWRLRLEQTSRLAAQLESTTAQLKPQLDSLTDELGTALERISGREKLLNGRLSERVAALRTANDTRLEASAKYKLASGGISERTTKLDHINDDIDELRQQIDEQAHRNNDRAPLVRVRAAVTRLEEQLRQLAVQLGVHEHALFAAQLRQRSAAANGMLMTMRQNGGGSNTTPRLMATTRGSAPTSARASGMTLFDQ